MDAFSTIELSLRIEQHSSIPVSQQICMTSSGIQLKLGVGVDAIASSLEQVLQKAGISSPPEDLIVYVYDRSLLRGVDGGVHNDAELVAESLMEQPVEKGNHATVLDSEHTELKDETTWTRIQAVRQDPAIEWTVQSRAYLTFFDSCLHLAKTYSNTIRIHHALCERLRSEAYCQVDALRLALRNLESHCKSVVDAWQSLQSYAERETRKHEALLENFEADLQVLRLIPVHSAISTEPRVLADYVKEDELRRQVDEMHDSIERLHREQMEMLDRISFVEQESMAEVHSLVDADLQRIDRTTQQVSEIFAQSVQTYEMMVNDTNNVKNFIQQGSASLLNLNQTIETHWLHHISALEYNDTAIRNAIHLLVEQKHVIRQMFIQRLQHISHHQSAIATISPKLQSLTKQLHSQSEKASQVLFVHRMPSAWGASLIEIVRRRAFQELFSKKIALLAEMMARFRGQEEKRRNTFRSEILQFIPQDLVKGLDAQPPHCEISISGNTVEELPPLKKQDILDFEHQVQVIRNQRQERQLQASQISTDMVKMSSYDSMAKLQATMLKVTPQVDAMEEEFERALNKSVFSHRLRKLEKENSHLRQELQSVQGPSFASKMMVQQTVDAIAAESPIFSSPINVSGAPSARPSSSSVAEPRYSYSAGDMEKLFKAEELVKSYEKRIRSLETLLQSNFASMRNHRESLETVQEGGSSTHSAHLDQEHRRYQQAMEMVEKMKRENQRLTSDNELVIDEISRLKTQLDQVLEENTRLKSTDTTQGSKGKDTLESDRQVELAQAMEASILEEEKPAALLEQMENALGLQTEATRKERTARILERATECHQRSRKQARVIRKLLSNLSSYQNALSKLATVLSIPVEEISTLEPPEFEEYSRYDSSEDSTEPYFRGAATDGEQDWKQDGDDNERSDHLPEVLISLQSRLDRLIQDLERKKRDAKVVRRVALEGFSVGDWVLFFPASREPPIWPAFHMDQPYYYLDPAETSPDLQWVLLQVQSIETREATLSANPFELAEGTRYHVCRGQRRKWKAVEDDVYAAATWKRNESVFRLPSRAMPSTAVALTRATSVPSKALEILDVPAEEGSPSPTMEVIRSPWLREKRNTDPGSAREPTAGSVTSPRTRPTLSLSSPSSSVTGAPYSRSTSQWRQTYPRGGSDPTNSGARQLASTDTRQDVRPRAGRKGSASEPQT